MFFGFSLIWFYAIKISQARIPNGNRSNAAHDDTNRNIEPKGEWIGVEFGLASLPPLGIPKYPPPHPHKMRLMLWFLFYVIAFVRVSV